MQCQGPCSFCGVSLLVRICLLCLEIELVEIVIEIVIEIATNFGSISIKYLMKLVCFREVFINE